MGQPEPESPPIAVKVVSQNWSDCIVYYVRSGAKYRLGIAYSVSTTILAIRERDLPPERTVQLAVRCIAGSEWYVSEPTPVTYGTYVELGIMHTLDQSYLAVYPTQ